MANLSVLAIIRKYKYHKTLNGHNMVNLNYHPCKNEFILTQRGQETPVLFNLENSNYYTLEGTAGRIWELCDGKHAIADIIDIISQEYNAPIKIAESDVIKLMENLTQEKIIFHAK